MSLDRPHLTHTATSCVQNATERLRPKNTRMKHPTAPFRRLFLRATSPSTFLWEPQIPKLLDHLENQCNFAIAIRELRIFRYNNPAQNVVPIGGAESRSGSSTNGLATITDVTCSTNTVRPRTWHADQAFRSQCLPFRLRTMSATGWRSFRANSLIESRSVWLAVCCSGCVCQSPTYPTELPDGRFFTYASSAKFALP